ncbi:MAG: thioredoxin family protein [Sulfurimonas sp.]|nr:thioredoxin family protein [Sulfurimonas sp.]
MIKIFISLLLILSVNAAASGIKWAEDYNAGMEEAKKANKPVLFISSRHTCKYCVKLDKTTLKDEKVIKELNKDFISIISYSDDDDYIPKKLWHPGTPAIWFLLPDGEPMFQPIMGAIKSKKFLEALNVVKNEFKEKLNKGKTE